MLDLEGKKWLIGVSGGPDSMALLQMCIEHHIEVFVAHVNYGVREQAKEEELYVQEFCKERNIPCFIKNEKFTYTGNFEACAREYRYAFFAELVKKYSLDGILTAHHMDDALETYIMQKQKHLIPAVYGIAQSRMYKGILLCRPLLSFTKKQLTEYLEQRHIRYYIDHTNLLDDHTRNKIRHSVIEEMSEEDKLHMFEKIQEENAHLTQERKIADTCFKEEKLSKKEYASKSTEIRLLALRKLLDPVLQYGLTQKYLLQLDGQLLKEKDSCIVYKQKWLIQEEGYIFLREDLQPYTFTIDTIEQLEKQWFSLKKEGTSLQAVTVSEEDFPLTIRNVQDMDKIVMRYGTKSVHRFLIDRKIPRWKRLVWPVIVNRHNEVIYVHKAGCDVGHYSSDPNVFLMSNL